MNYQLINPINPNYSVVEQILTNRGFKQEEVQHYLNTTDEDILSPELVPTMQSAVNLLLAHLQKESNILVIVDSDCDGYTASAGLLNYLYLCFPSIVLSKFKFVFHDGKQHGINLSMVEDDIGLVIAPDSSSNDYEIHHELKQRGIDVLVIDHHQAEKISPDACIVNNQLCDYPNKTLSGAGMVYKFCQHFDKICGFNHANEILDLVALGIIADMVSVQNYETKRIIDLGLEHLRNPFIRAMRDKNSFKLGYDNITPIGVAWYIAPFVNAVSRVGTQEEKRTLFESMLIWKAHEKVPSTKRGHNGEMEELVEQSVRNCTNIKNRQSRTQDTNVDIIEDIIQKQGLYNRKIIIIQLEKSVDRNLSGLIANKLMSKYQRPVAILNKYIDDKTNITRWEGSARGYDKSEVTDFREFVRKSGLAYLAEG